MPLLAVESYLARGAGQLPLGQGLAHGGASLGGSATFGARGRLLVRGSYGRIVGEVLFEQPSGQFACQGTDTVFSLVEGDGGLTLGAVKIEVEGSFGLLKPLTAEILALLGGVRDLFAHGDLLGRGPGIRRIPVILSRRCSCKNGNGPPSGSRPPFFAPAV